MLLYTDWKTILTKAWSMRFMALASVSNGVLIVLSIAPDLLPKSWGTTATIAGFAVVFDCAAMWSRLVYQKSLNGNNK